MLLLCLAMLAPVAFGQRPGSRVPREEKLLNGLKLLMWSDPSATDVKVSIRIHSGSAFDPQGKEGVMKLLAENVFPTADSRAYFSEDLGGSLEVISNYDFIQINATAKSSEFVTLLDTLAQAVAVPTIDKETTEALKKALAAKLMVLEKDPTYVAEQSVAKRLFGSFPYGRPQTGSVESIQRIDFADLLFAKDRFLSADNATVAISGNFNSDLGFRAARRYFGAWLKSDKRVPSTFRQPDAPDTKPLELVISGGAQSSYALRGLSRSEPDYVASLVLVNVLKARGARMSGTTTVSHQARVLPGVLMISVQGAGAFPFGIFADRISEAEFSNARTESAADFEKRSLMDQWLDVDTYRTTVAGDELTFKNVTIADVQRVADRLSKNPIAAVVVRPATASQ